MQELGRILEEQRMDLPASIPLVRHIARSIHVQPLGGVIREVL